MIPVASATAYEAARHRAAYIERSDRGRIVVSGSDRASYLQGLLTNDIASLQPGRGCYAAYLTPQGRMIADAFVYELGDLMLMSLPLDVTERVLMKLDQVIFAEDVQLGNVTETFGQIAIVGPESASVVEGVLEAVAPAALDALPEHGNLRASFAASTAIVASIADAGEPGFDVFVERDRMPAFIAAVQGAQAVALDRDAADAIRIEAGVPQFRRDMDEDTIPLEAGIESRAISFTKGCYVGQEVIIRVLHRGHGRVARKLVGLRLEGPVVPEGGALIRTGDREIGRVTSAAFSPALDRPIALGYVHRDFTAPDVRVDVDGATAIVTALPFV